MTEALRIVFLGSADFACPCLDALLRAEGVRVAAVVTQPDRPRGRQLHLAACPSKARAQAAGIPVLTPVSINTPESIAALRDLRPGLLVVVAYGQILRRAVLDLAPLGCVNIHASLLPAYRGAAPISWAIAAGERETGVTAMYINERMDAGDIIAQQRVAIAPDDTGGTLHDRLAAAGAELLAQTVAAIRAGRAARTPQDESRVTYAPKLTKEDGRIDWTAAAERIHNRVRGFQPWPGSFCTAPGKDGKPGTLRVRRTRAEPGAGEPGLVLDAGADGPLVAAGAGAVRLLEVQPEGGRAMPGGAYLRGHALRVGDRLA
jgi:methionyl-tRNA formyltransferase